MSEKKDKYDVRDIDPLKLYPRSFCCRIIPSAKPEGGGIHEKTWDSWRRRGKLQAVKVGDRWFMKGEDLLRLLHASCVAHTPKPMLPRSEAETQRAYERAMRRIAELTAPKRKKPAPGGQS